MDTPSVTPDMEAIIGAIGRYSDGATYDDIVAGLSKPLPKGKVGFLVQQLETMGRIRSEKSAGTVHYFLVQSTPISKPDAAENATTLAQTASPSAEPAGAAPTDPKAESTPTVAQQPPVSSLPPSAGVQGPVAQPGKNPPAETSSSDVSAGALPTSPVQSVPSSGGPTDSTTAKAGAAGAGATDALFATAFADCVFTIVTTPGGGGKDAALYILQQHAIKVGVDLKAFVAYGRARLEKLTKQEAESYEIEPEQFDSWHSRYFGQSSEQPVARSEHAAEKDTEEPETKSDRAAAKKRATSSGENAPATPKGMAKFLAKHVEPYVPEEFRPYVRWAVIIIGGALLTPLIVLLNTHPWQALGVVAAVIAIAGIVVWVKRKLAAGEGGAPSATKESGARSSESTAASAAETVGGALCPDSASDSNVSVSASQRISVSPRRSRRGLYILALGGIGLAAAVAAAVYFWPRTARPPIEAISAELVKAAAPLPVRVAAINVTYLPGSEVSMPVQYQARLETIEPLFKAENTTAYLRAHFPNEMTAITAAEKLLAGPDAGPIRAAAGPAPASSFSIWNSRRPEGARDSSPSQSSGPAPTAPAISALRAPSASDQPILRTSDTPADALASVVLVSVSAPPGTAAPVSGTLTAWQQNGVWVFSHKPLFIDRTALAGEPKPANAFAVDFPEDEARLKALIAEQAAYAAKVQAAATALAADLERARVQAAAALERERQQKAADLMRENQQKAADLERDRQQKLTALNQLLQRGTFLSGIFVDSRQSQAHPVLLEITACSASTHQITMVLRNTSGWNKSRTGTGDWAIDTENETCNAKVWFSSNERIPGAGAPLDDTGSWYLTFHVSLDGTVATEMRGWELQRVAAADVAATKTEFGFGRVASTKESGVKDPGAGGAGAPSGRTEGQKIGGSGAANSPSGGSVDRRLGGSDSVTPLDRSTATPVAATLSAADLQFFSVAASPAAYARVDGNWVRLPTNGAKPIQNTAQKLTGLVQNFGSFQDRLAGKTSDASTTEIGELRFDGIEPVPAVPAKDVMIVYVGTLAPFTAADVSRHPELKDYPVVELALEKTLSKTVRYASLYRVASGFLGFGSSRVTNAAVESAAPNLTVLHGTGSIGRGQYAVACGSDAYEVRVE